MNDTALLRAFGLEDLEDQVTITRRASVEYRNTGNGYHKTITVRCFNCGVELETKRHVPGTRAVCGKVECRRAAGAARQKDLRVRKSKI